MPENEAQKSNETFLVNLIGYKSFRLATKDYTWEVNDEGDLSIYTNVAVGTVQECVAFVPKGSWLSVFELPLEALIYTENQNKEEVKLTVWK